MGKLQKLAGQTVLYGVGSFLPRFLNFLLVPLHTDVFAPADYGVISKILAFVGVLNVLYTFGMETAYFRFATKPGADEKSVYNLAQTVVVGISLILSVILIAKAGPIANALDVEGSNNLVIWFVLIMFIDAVVAIPFARLRLQNKAVMFAVGRVANVVILIGLNLYFLKVAYNPTVGIAYIVLANLIANAFYLLFFARMLASWRPAIDKTVSPVMLSYSYPIMLTGLAGMTSEMFSRQTLDWWLPQNFYPGQTPKHALGIFSACYKLAVLMSLAIQAFRYAAEPFFFSNASDKQSPQLFAQINHYFIIVCCVLLLGVSINLDVLKLIFLPDPEYWEGLNVVPILLLAYLFNGVYYNMSVWFKLTDKTYYATIITVAGALVTIIANFLLIPILGYMGSALATLACYVFTTALSYWLGQKYFPIPYKILRGLLYIIGTTLLAYIVNSFVIESLILATAVHIFVLIVYIGGVYLVEKKGLRL